ncbi:MAG TPA: decarboxylating 6-phosphogluconate dehydrogenase [Actinomycetota bacterium]|nr:decarboxylating 6-phosphogluconate dehydrogenase [Actinomycetota bacterium]
MELGVVGLGRMGANISRRLMRDGHRCVAFDLDPAAVERLTSEGAVGAASVEELVAALAPPRAVWVMVPAGDATEAVVRELGDRLQPSDVVIDGGNTYYRDDVRRAGELGERGIRYVDCGTSGGVHGLERGFCLMVGGDADVFEHVEPILASLAPGVGAVTRTRGREGDPSPAEQGYLHCGPAGAGHFVKMVHNGIEYGLMASYAEGLNILRHAEDGGAAYRIDVAEVAEVWRRGSVVASWLLDLAAAALHEDTDLEGSEDQVSDSGEGRWNAITAIESGTPAEVLTAALYARFASRDEASFANRVLSAMRREFGGHVAD